MLFGNKQESNLRSCSEMVADVLSELGHPIDKNTGTDWEVATAGSRVLVTLFARGEKNFLRILAPVVALADVADEAALCRHLLELNAAEVSGAAFALQGGEVVVVAERSTVDLDRSEVKDGVERMRDYAGRYRQRLREGFLK